MTAKVNAWHTTRHKRFRTGNRSQTKLIFNTIRNVFELIRFSATGNTGHGKPGNIDG